MGLRTKNHQPQRGCITSAQRKALRTHFSASRRHSVPHSASYDAIQSFILNSSDFTEEIAEQIGKYFSGLAW